MAVVARWPTEPTQLRVRGPIFVSFSSCLLTAKQGTEEPGTEKEKKEEVVDEEEEEEEEELVEEEEAASVGGTQEVDSSPGPSSSQRP